MTQQQIKQMRESHKEVVLDYFLTEEEDAQPKTHTEEQDEPSV